MSMAHETNRREFIFQTAAAVGAAAWGGRLIAAAEPSASSDGNSKSAAGSAGNALTKEPVPLAPPDRQPPKLNVPEPAQRKVGWAVVGLGELALGEVMPAFHEAKLSQPVALVSGHPYKARKVAEAYGISADAIYDYESFDRIVQDKRVEIIYIILPNSMHAEFTIRGLKAGKHVLCEKPMAASVEDCERMIAAQKETGKKLMVAYRLHYEPFNQKVMAFCQKKTYGAVKTFSASNCQNVEAPNIRLSTKLGGGPVGDVGVYCINAARYVIGEEPLEIAAFSRTSPKTIRVFAKCRKASFSRCAIHPARWRIATVLLARRKAVFCARIAKAASLIWKMRSAIAASDCT